MRYGWIGSLFVLLAALASVHADDRKEIDRVIDKAIEAAGGKEKLAEIKAVVWKSRATIHDRDGVSEIIGEYAKQKPDCYREEITIEKNGKKSKRITVVNGSECWVNENGQTKMLDQHTLSDKRESNFGIALANNPTSLRNSDLTLSLLGKSKLGDKEVIGIRVVSKEYCTVDVFFDQRSGLTAKSIMHRRDGAKQVPIETLYDYPHDASGVVLPHKATTLRDGKAIAEQELLEFRTYTMPLDESFFTKP
jgi:outer membrane lipoprotein-sorting protein